MSTFGRHDPLLLCGFTPWVLGQAWSDHPPTPAQFQHTIIAGDRSMFAKAGTILLGALAAAILFGASIGAGTAVAQPQFTVAQCGGIVSIINNTDCSIYLYLETDPPGVWYGLVFGPRSMTPVSLPYSTVSITGLFSVNGVYYPINSPAVPGYGCLTDDWWVGNVTIGGNGCCA